MPGRGGVWPVELRKAVEGILVAPAAILGVTPRAQERSSKGEFGYFGSNRFIAAAKDNPTASVTNK